MRIGSVYCCFGCCVWRGVASSEAGTNGVIISGGNGSGGFTEERIVGVRDLT